MALLDGALTAERCRDRCRLEGMPHRVVKRLRDQRSFVVLEMQATNKRTFGRLVKWGGLLRSRAERLDVTAARLACTIVLSGVEAFANPKPNLKSAA